MVVPCGVLWHPSAWRPNVSDTFSPPVTLFIYLCLFLSLLVCLGPRWKTVNIYRILQLLQILLQGLCWKMAALPYKSCFLVCRSSQVQCFSYLVLNFFLFLDTYHPLLKIVELLNCRLTFLFRCSVLNFYHGRGVQYPTFPPKTETYLSTTLCGRVTSPSWIH